VDTDGDAIADAWETLGIDFNEDGTTDLVLAGANPRHKDLYVEIDAMDGRAPDPANLARVATGSEFTSFTGADGNLHFQRLSTAKDGFWIAPNVLVQNPDGEAGVDIHLKLDEKDLPLISWAGLDTSAGFNSFFILKGEHFGTPG